MIIALVVIVAAYLFYTESFTKIPSSSQYDFTNLVDSCNIGSSAYVVCCQRGNSVFNCESPTAVPEDLVVVKLNLASIAKATDSYYLCMNDNLYHPPHQMPEYASDALIFSSAFQDSDSGNLSLSYVSSKEVRNIFVCTKKLYPTDSYQFVTYGLIPNPLSNLPSSTLSKINLARVNLITAFMYNDTNYKSLEDFITKQSSSIEILRINIEVNLK